ncbi:MAG: Cache 3/Cache 2 fusion domain-containing protein [Treponema sp.]|jgi:methyl-accepting chemotaxis protein|nr:Cache 3/Cache 2 fusion domain-containing protein [Treponema sp.]
MKKSEDSSISILIKIAALSSGFVFIGIMVLAFISISSMRTISLETALIMARNKIRGDIASFQNTLKNNYGNLSLNNGTLVDQHGEALNERYDLVDKVSEELGIVATIFVREGNDYKRITTSIRNASGQRAVNTMLGTSSVAYNAVNSGTSFIGEVTILEKSHLAGYQPLFAENSRTIIGILFVGIEMSIIRETIAQRIYYEIRLMIGIVLILLVATSLLNVLVFRQIIVRPIRTVVDMLKDISEGEGDLTRRLMIKSRDEIEAMAKYFNHTFDKIKTLVAVIKLQSTSLLNIGNELDSNMTESAVAINHITANIKGIKGQVLNQSSGITEANATMEHIASNISNLNDHIEKQSTRVSQSSLAIEKTLANIQSVTQTLIKNADNVTALAAASEAGRTSLQGIAEDIQEIAHESEGLMGINLVMQNIASQTNLLSMNAAIEAAHAGASGKGFAVVADEIRKLAESSGEQSKTISVVLKKITEAMHKISNATGTVLQKFEAIEVGVKTVSVQEEHIRKAMEEQNAGSKQILEAITQLNRINQIVKSGALEMLTGSQEVIKESKNLDTVTHQLAEGVSEMAVSVELINTAINHVNTISGENKERIGSLVQEVERFKIE